MDFYFQRQYRGTLKGILLDWAGTTMDYGCYAPATVFVEVYRRKGVPIAVDEARVPMGAHKKVHIRKNSQLPEVNQRWQAALGRQPNEDDIEGMFHDFTPLQLACLADYVDLIPGSLRPLRIFASAG